MSLNFNLLGKSVDFEITCTLPEKEGSAMGKIEFLKSDEYTVYISWNVYSKDGSSIGGRSDNFFSKSEERSNESVMAQVIDQIEKFRIGRKGIFKEFRIKQ